MKAKQLSRIPLSRSCVDIMDAREDNALLAPFQVHINVERGDKVCHIMFEIEITAAEFDCANVDSCS